MDLITHGVLGATLAASLAPSHQRRLAAAVGMAGGMLPDADTLIQSPDDVLLVLDYHRHFTHALAFAPVGALIAASLLWLLLRNHLSFPRLYLYALAGCGVAGLLDACTSYGTHLWLPFSDRKEAWNLIAVFDPVFTLLILVPLALALWRPRRRMIPVGLALAAAYLGLGLLQHQRAEAALRDVLAARDHGATNVVIKPTMANQVLWRTLYVRDGRLYTDAFHLGWKMRHYPGESAPLMTQAAVSRLVGNYPRRREDLERFRHFSDGFLIADPTRPDFVGDGRYALLPTRIAPIWGLEWTADGAPAFVTRRDVTPEIRRDFIAMLTGSVLTSEQTAQR
jgi:inner membrane protein